MRVPKYCKNSDGRAFSIIPNSGKKRVYFGEYGSDESQQRYAEWLKRLSANDEPEPQMPRPHSTNYRSLPTSISMLLERYLNYAEDLYPVNGANSEYYAIEYALTPLAELYGSSSFEDIGPKMLTTLQRHMAQSGLSRITVNQRIGRVKRFVKWCCSEEFIPPEKYAGLLSVSGLKRNQYGVQESQKVKPVLWSDASQVLPYVSPQIATMIKVQYLCGMRPQDVTRMRPVDIDQSGDVWFYRPESHKTAHLGKELVKAIPKDVQELLGPFMDRDNDAYLFSPRESQLWRFNNQEPTLSKERKTPIYPC